MAQRPTNRKFYRNRVRGLLHQAKERGFGISDTTRLERMRLTLRSALLDARLTLPAARYEENLNWLYSQTELAFSAPLAFVGQGLLFRNIYSPSTVLRTELEWIAARLQTGKPTLARHLIARERLSVLYLEGKRDEAIEELDSVEREIGDSHWSIALRLAVLQTFDGIEAQKAFLTKIRSRSSSGLTAAFAFHASVRNEPSVSIPWFESGIKRRRFSKRYPEHKLYLDFALLGAVPAGVDDIATVLRVEQANTDVDVYETSLAIAQSLVNRRASAEIKDSLVQYVKALQQIVCDPRLDKLLYLLNGPLPDGATSTNEAALDNLLSGKSAEISSGKSSEYSADPASLIWEALARAAVASTDRSAMVSGTPLELAKEQLTVVAGRFCGYENARLGLAKHARNLSGLTYSRMLGEVSEALSFPSLNDLPEKLASAAAASTTYGTLELLASKRDGRDFGSPITTLGERFVDAFYSTGTHMHLSEAANAICSFRVSIREGSAPDLVSKIEKQIVKDRPFLRDWGWLAALELYRADGDLGSSLRLIGNWAATANEEDAPIPIEASLAPFSPKFLAQSGREVTTPIALEAWRRASDSETRRRYVRLAYNRFMAGLGVDRPSMIPATVIEKQPALFITFLRDICLPDIMDMSKGARSSLSLQEERVAICALLRRVDPGRASSYEDEILEITQSLSIWEGLKTVDSTRIHVEETAFTLAALSELQGSFDRYASLVKAGVGVAPNFDEVLRSLHRDPEYAEGMSMPTNEADQLLAEMVRKMKGMFLKNSIYGLHGFLSRRIRHGSLIGHLRGPVERHRLITQMSDASGSYAPNDYWLARISPADPAARQKIERAFVEFSRAFDRELLSLRDEKLHVKDDHHTNGIFDIPISSSALSLIRSSIKSDLTLRSLIRAALVSFWVLLTPALKEAEQLVKFRFQLKASELFNRLESTVAGQLLADEAAKQFTVAMRLAVEETQFQVRTVASWFDKTDDKSKMKTYTLYDAIEVGVKSAKAAIFGFDPYVIKVCDNLNIPAVNLQFVADAVLIALSNIHKYSQTGNAPRVDINASIHAEGGTLILSVVSDVACGVRNAESESKLERIRANIANRSYENFVGTEGNSGFYKLAALVHQSDSGDVRFGFTEQGGFELKIVLSLILDGAATGGGPLRQESVCEY